MLLHEASERGSVQNLWEILERRAAETPDRRAYTFLAEGETEAACLTWGELRTRAAGVAEELAARGLAGERALLLFPSGLDFLVGFLGCLAAGVIAVPNPPPRPGRDEERLRGVRESCRPRLVLTVSPLVERFRRGDTDLFAGLETLAVDRMQAAGEWGAAPSFRGGEDLAFLQYTSGSTGRPRGVKVSHANLRANAAWIARSFGLSAESVIVSWLPAYHDMGLIGGLLQPLYLGARLILLPPAAFLQRPRRWLAAIDRYRATTSGGPNFAYDLCVERIAPQERAGLSLECWSVAFNGAEPVRAGTFERFAAAFAPHGFDHRAFLPCYGLAEATLCVSAGPRAAGPLTRPLDRTALEGGRVLPRAEFGEGAVLAVASGACDPAAEVAIVDPSTCRRAPPDGVGEIWVRSPSVGGGYWGLTAESRATFGAFLAGPSVRQGPYLRTGDLGFVDPTGQLFVTGRLKDLIILRGRNLYPQDLERTAAASHSGFVTGAGAAFAEQGDRGEEVALVLEVRRRLRNPLLEGMVEAARAALAREQEVALARLVLVREGDIPRTSSGKVRRRRCRELLQSGALSPLVDSRTSARPVDRGQGPSADPSPALAATTGEARAALATGLLLGWVAELVGVPASRLSPASSLAALGVDSLRTEVLALRLRQELGLAATPELLLGSANLFELVRTLHSVPEGEERPPAVASGPGERQRLSQGQRALWFHQRLAPASAAYNLPLAAELTGRVDLVALEGALSRVIARHGALRSRFGEEGGEPWRVEAAAEPFILERVEAEGLARGDLCRELARRAWAPFDPSAGPLIRGSVFTRGAGAPILLLTAHHLALDFSSLELLLGELAHIYAAFVEGREPAALPEPGDYGASVRAEEAHLARLGDEGLAAARRDLALADPPRLELPLDRPRPRVAAFRGGARAFRISPALTRKLAHFAARGDATPYMALAAAFGALAARLAGASEAMVGSPTAGPGGTCGDAAVGYRVNPLPLRLPVRSETTGRDLLAAARQRVLATLAHAAVPSLLLAHGGRDRRSAASLYPVLVVFERARRPELVNLGAFALGEEGARLELGGLVLSAISLSHQAAQLDLALRAAEDAGGLTCRLIYDRELFDATTVERWARSLVQLLAGLCSDAAARVLDLPLLGAAERAQLSLGWNDTAAQASFEPVQLAILARAAEVPERLAVVHGTEALSFGELEARVHALAAALRARGLKREGGVALALERGVELVAALVGVLAAGGAYLPLDPAQPAARHTYLLTAAGVQIAIAGAGFVERQPQFSGAVLDPTPRAPAEGAARALAEVEPEELAYVLYTSGSTGEPKGVMVRHASLANLRRALAAAIYPDAAAGSRVGLNAPLSFDASVKQWLTLADGHTLVVVPEPARRDASGLPDFLAANRLAAIDLTPSVLRLLLEAGLAARAGELSGLRVLVGGEAIDPPLWGRAAALAGPTLVNVYGPTECTVDTTALRLTPWAQRPSLGRPLSGVWVAVMGPRAELCPLGVAGELWVGGAGLARGYLMRPALTAERFVPAPGTSAAGARCYRTGDRVRRLQDGRLEFLGRLDRQVKLRGVRVEPGEVEAALRSLSGVAEAAVGVADGGEAGPALVAGVVASGGAPLSPATLRAELAQRLPDALMPARIALLDALPRTASGKLDRAALPLLMEAERGFETPFRTPTEELLAVLWGELLGVRRVVPEDDFFALGGHSLAAVRLAAEVRRIFAAELELAQIFLEPTLAGLAAVIDSGGRSSPPLLPLRADRGAELPLSFAQERLWFLEQRTPGRPTYHLPLAVHLRGPLLVFALARSVSALAERHEALRTAFVERGGGAWLRVLPRVELRLPVVDLTAVAPAAALAARLLTAEARRPFDLGRPPLARFLLLRHGRGEHAFGLTLHHAIADGASGAVLSAELEQLYAAAAAGAAPPALPPLLFQPTDLALWERQALAADPPLRELEFWRRVLAGPSPEPLPADRERGPAAGGEGRLSPFCCGGFAVAELLALARRERVTPFVAVLAALEVLLARLSGGRWVAVATAVALREQPGSEGLVGMLTNLAVLKGEVGAESSFVQLLAAARSALLAAHTHRRLPYERAVEAVAAERSGAPLFQAALTLAERAPSLALAGLACERLRLETGTSRFELSFMLALEEGAIRGEIESASDLFDRTTIERWAEQLCTLLGELAAAPERPVAACRGLSASAAHQLCLEWNAAAGAGGEMSWGELLQAAAAERPAAIAATSSDEQTSFGELARRASGLAAELARRGLGPEVRVGVVAERSLAWLAAVLALERIGAAYLPLDPAYPDERLRLMVEDASARALLARAGDHERFEVAGLFRLSFEEGETRDEKRSDPPSPTPDPEALAYLIYTSGSTGRPKGVGISRRALAQFTAAFAACVPLTPAAVVLQLSSPSFDASILELGAWLAAGGRLVLAERAELRPGPPLAALLAERAVSAALIPPSLLSLLSPAEVAPLTTLVVGGEAATGGLALGYGSGRRLVNAYGPTEVTVAATAGPLSAGERPTLGRPLAGAPMFCVDASLLPLPPGAAGELVVAGPRLARGYLGRGALTAASFRPDGLTGAPGGRIYRTGDRGRLLADGRLEFLGRLDEQVKLRGVRIEPGEIESALLAEEAVAEAAVAVLDDGGPSGPRLAAYVVARGGASLVPAALAASLAGRLPAGLLPALWAVLPALPRTPSGKLDRKSLGAVATGAVATGASGAFRRPEEELLALAWGEALGQAVAGPEADFFALGGHSLAAVQAARRATDLLGRPVPLHLIFEERTPAAVAAALGRKWGEEGAGAGPRAGEGSGAGLPSLAQERLWFLARLHPRAPLYNLPALLRLSGPLQPRALTLAYRGLVSRQEALRAALPAGAGRPRLEHLPVTTFPLPWVDLTALAAARGTELLAALAQRWAELPFDLDSGPLVRLAVLRLARERHGLLVNLHHAVADGHSVALALAELSVLYRAVQRGEVAHLPPLPISYADFACWQRREAESAAAAAALARATSRLAGVGRLELPTDRPRGPRPELAGHRLSLFVGGELMARLAALGRAHGATRFMTCLALAEVLLFRLSGESTFVLATPEAGRPRRELDPVVGFFANTLALVADLGGRPTLGAHLARVRAQVLAAATAAVPFGRLVEATSPARDPAADPLASVLFSWEEEAPRLDLPDLAAELERLHPGVARFDRALTLRPQGEGWLLELEDRSALFDRTTGWRFLRGLCRLMEAAPASAELTIDQLPQAAPAELQQLREWNDTAADCGRNDCLDERLAAALAGSPEAVAVALEAEQLSAGALSAAAAQLARTLRRRGVGPGVLVGVGAERSAALEIALLAVLAAGGAYVPLDPDLPTARLAAMIADAEPPLVLADAALASRLPATGAAVLPLVMLPAGGAPLACRRADASPADPVYAIFTSGSTGRPKGALNSHRGVVNRLAWAQARFPLGAADRVLQKTPIGFDVSVWELFWPLLAGARLVFAPPGAHRDPAALARVIREQGITLLHFVPSLLGAFLGAGGGAALAPVRRLMASGEALPAELAERLGRTSAAELVNLYGPTEAAVDVSWWRLDPAHLGRAIPIGRPVANTALTVVDGALCPVPLGGVGELLLAGAQIGSGYLARPAETARRFVPEAFLGIPGGRAYRTGDLVRRAAGGELEYLGRIDLQVKVRGVRIELGEIESAFLALPAVAEAAVVLHHGAAGEPLLTAFLVTAAAGGADLEDLCSRLAQRLPEAMLPAAFELLPALPRTASGKVDRRALAALPLSRSAVPSAPPADPLEEVVAGIWAELLGRSPGRDESFFALGGHSLAAARLAARLEGATGIALGLAELLAVGTVAGQADLVRRHLSGGGGEPPEPIRPRPAGSVAPLTAAQERLWFREQLEPGSGAYHVPAAFRLRGGLNVPRLACALSALEARHEAVRTRFPAPGGIPVQEVAAPGGLPLPVVDLAGLADAAPRQAEERIAALARLRFDLARGSLARACLLRLGAGDHAFALCLHHLICDGWSFGILGRELGLLYAAAEPAVALPALALQPADLAAWQRRELAAGRGAADLAFWQRELAEARPSTWPQDRAPRAGRGRPAASLLSELSAAELAALAALAREAGVTLFMVLCAGLATLLSRAEGSSEAVLGTPHAGRSRPELEGLVGFFVNTLVLRLPVAGAGSFHSLLAATSRRCLAAFARADLPLELASSSPPYRALLVLQNAPSPPWVLAGLAVEALAVEAPAAKVDLTLFAVPAGERLALRLVYDAELYEAVTIERLLGSWRLLLAAAAASPETAPEALPLLSAEERAALLSAPLASTGLKAAPQATVHSLILAWAAATPDAIALSEGGERLSYDALAQRSGGLARVLFAAGLEPEERVAIAAEGLAAIFALLAVLRAGGAYVALDLRHPAARQARVLAAAGVRQALVTTAGRAVLPAGPQVVHQLAGAEAATSRASSSLPVVDPGQLAYVTFTSGSTGTPKGVAVEHRHLGLYLAGLDAALAPPPRASWAVVTTLAADLGNTAVYGALTRGGMLRAVPASRAADLEELAAELEREPVDAIKIVPSHLAALLAAAEPSRFLPRRLLVSGGEALPWPLAERTAATASPGFLLVNHYGPSETTVGALAGPAELSAESRRGLTVPLGRPLGAARILLLDGSLEPVPLGAVGEIAIGGGSVARGYLGQAAATAAAFRPDPCAAEVGARLYFTGDRARRTAAGDVEFLGRGDFQVKIRGFRIELGEIEAALRSHPALTAAVVVTRGPIGAEKLAAYAVPDPALPEPGTAELCAFLGERLPPAMVPSTFTLLAALPLTANGKLDRRALPEPSGGGAAASPPRDGREELLSRIFAELLGRESVGREESFFALGGHSLLATQAVVRARELFGVGLTVRDLFAAPTVAGLAERAARLGDCPALPALFRRAERSEHPLSFAQERIWFQAELEPSAAAFHLPYHGRLEGPLAVVRLAVALARLTARHEILRTVFVERAGRRVALVQPATPRPLPVVDLGALLEEARQRVLRRVAEGSAARPFALGVRPPWRAALVRLGAEDHALLLTLHHLLSDAWARELLTRELAALYSGGEVPELPLQYGDFAAWQRESEEATAYAPHLAFFRQRLAGIAALELPTDRPRPAVPSGRGAAVRFRLPPALVAELRGAAAQAGATEFMLLFAALAALLARLCGRSDFALGTPVANRPRRELEGLLGVFINLLALPAETGGDPTAGELVRRVRESALAAYTHQDLPFERLVAELAPERRLGQAPLFQVMLMVQNVPRERPAFTGLRWERLETTTETARLDLTWTFAPAADEALDAWLEVDRALFDTTTAERWAGSFTTFLRGFLPGRDHLSALPLLSAAERHQLEVEWNDHALARASLALPAAVLRQAAESPERAAVVAGAKVLRYGELCRRAARLAARLTALGAGPDAVVGVYLERTPELVVALLGIHWAACADLPLDPFYPAERLAFMLADAGVVAVVTSEALASTLPPTEAPLVCLDREAGGPPLAEPAAVLPENLAYVIYTSGSTGRPKGVMVPHGALSNFFAAMDERLGERPAGRWLALTSISFDISVLELLWTLARGFEVVLEPGRERGRVESAPAPRPAHSALKTSLFFFASDESQAEAEKYRLLIEGARLGDRYGFHAVWTPERHFHAFGGLYPAPAVVAAALAMVTERIGLRAGSVVAPLDDPLRVAEAWSVVDNLSRGRVGVSFASGWHANDFVLAPASYERRGEILFAHLDEVRRLWRGEAVERRGGTGQAIEVRIHPRPLQGELPIWVTAAGNPETFRRAGEIGAGLLTHLLAQSVEDLADKLDLYRRAYRAAGHPGAGHVTLMMHTFLGSDLEQVREAVREPLSQYLRGSIDLWRGLAKSFGVDPTVSRLTPAEERELLAHAFDRYFEHSSLMGTPESALGMVERLEAQGIDEVACLVDFGLPAAQVLAGLEQLQALTVRIARPAPPPKAVPLPEQIARHAVTHLQCTPSMARVLLDEAGPLPALAAVEELLVGGEALSPSLAAELTAAVGGRVRNLYGPTETTIWSTMATVEAGGRVTLGRPLANTSIAVVDSRLELAPLGVPGEVMIGGEGVVRGYLGRPALTAERFLPDPLGSRARPGRRWYRTGDRARFSRAGELEFLGRLDHQIKLRGYRIELGEVEAALAAHPALAEAAVAAWQAAPGDARLVAYGVPQRAPGGGLVPRALTPAVSGADRERLLATAARFTLPNGMAITHLSELQASQAYRNIFEQRIYLRHGLRLAPGDAVLDVGGNAGLFTLFVHACCPGLSVYTFEPIPPTFEVLTANLALYGKGGKAYNFGLSDREERAPFTFYRRMSGLSGRYSEAARDREITRAVVEQSLRELGEAATLASADYESVFDRQFEQEIFECQLRPLSDVLAELAIEEVALLKIDVERAELDVVRGIRSTDWARIRQVVMEVDSPENLAAIRTLLEGEGFVVTSDQDIAVAATAERGELAYFHLYATRQPGGFATDEPELATPGQLREYLLARLPEHMVPSHFVLLDALPRTPNGKLDRRALPLPELSRATLDEAYVAPSSALEGTIAEVWSELLHLDRVGVNDNFFELGGTSLLLVRARSRLNEALGAELSLVDLFRFPTVALLAAAVAGEGRSGGADPESVTEVSRERGSRERAALGRRGKAVRSRRELSR